ncbi:conserved exported hypothetical protein [Candidatus Desulfarcum epimagneticum]|uniref:Cell envelope biogenesis protein OmpA n=1 Tax=uncultured Desulfobacteraceae bacterium TaxID=218296 RepID=A0A484HK38_9BACT|nr:conserved exported hypothetical protein [uncultured Desulfobacteraceae bacterium]
MKNMLKWMTFLIAATFLTGCASGPVETPGEAFAPASIDTTALEPGVGHLMIILDSSFSMAASQKGERHFDLAKTAARRMIRTLPAGMEIKSSLRSFEKGKSLYGPAMHSTDDFMAALGRMSEIGGSSSMSRGIDAVSGALSGAGEKTAAVIISDGDVIGDDPVRAAARLKKQWGDSLCVYTVHTGFDLRGARVMDGVARAGECGFFVNAKDILAPGAMADFVKRALFVPTPYPDSDGDGVFDHLDKCPATPESVKIDALGCPLDADGDGVGDDRDQCPGTLKGAGVDARGCWFLGGALFDSNDTALKPGASVALDEVARILAGNPLVRAMFIGHTDSRGSATYNMRLSIKRANAAKAYMFKKGIDPARISTAGRGETLPRASNDTEEGRAANRRIEIQIMK